MQECRSTCIIVSRIQGMLHKRAEKRGTNLLSLSSKADAKPKMIFEDLYVWLIFVSSMDIMLTWLILGIGGSEVNPVANAVLAVHGFWGMIAFKFAIVMLVVIACEIVGRAEQLKGKRLAMAAVGISSVPLFWSMYLLFTVSVTSFAIAYELVTPAL